MEPVAGKAPRHAGPRHPTVVVHYISGEPRSGLQFVERPARSSTYASGSLSGDDRAPLARAGNADALSRTGIWRKFTISVLCGPPGRAGPPRASRPPRIFVTIPQLGG